MRTWVRLGFTALLGLGSAGAGAAQTDYYNTDAGRPILIEDAYPLERFAFELQLAPLRLERSTGGRFQWGLEPEIAYGALPRTQVEVGVPVAFVDGGDEGRASGIAGIDVAVLHNLNAETSGLPAFALSGDLLLPVGGLGPDRAYPSVKGIVTRTFGFARFHANGQYTFGAAPGGTGDASPPVGRAALEVARWTAGVAVDRTFPLRSVLVTGDVHARRPMEADAELEWGVEAGVRYQLSPRLALDAGAGRRLTGDERGWFITFGTAYVFAVRSLIPVSVR